MRAIVRKIVLTAAIAVEFAATPAAAQQGASWFTRADRNDDGRVTWAEYQRTQRAYDALGLDRGGRYERGTAVRYDLNRDGRLTRAEYTLSLRAQFRGYDRNDDGVVTRREAAPDATRRPDVRRDDDRRDDDRRSSDRRRS